MCKLLAGKIRNRVSIYNGGSRPAMTGQTPQDYGENTAKMKESKEGFTLINQTSSGLLQHGNDADHAKRVV